MMSTRNLMMNHFFILLNTFHSALTMRGHEINKQICCIFNFSPSPEPGKSDGGLRGKDTMVGRPSALQVAYKDIKVRVVRSLKICFSDILREILNGITCLS